MIKVFYSPIHVLDPSLVLLVPEGHWVQAKLDSWSLKKPTGQFTQSFRASSYFIPRGHLTERSIHVSQSVKHSSISQPAQVYLSLCLSVSLSICLSVCLSVCLPVSPSICLSVCLSVCLSACLSICLFDGQLI